MAHRNRRITRPLTCQAANNTHIDTNAAAQLTAKANWQADCYKEKRVTRFFSHYQYRLVNQNEKLLIATKETILLNDSLRH